MDFGTVDKGPAGEAQGTVGRGSERDYWGFLLRGVYHKGGNTEAGRPSFLEPSTMSYGDYKGNQATTKIEAD
jgi:hypothetical protein